VAEVREILLRVGIDGENIIGGNDLAKMKEVIQQLENIKNHGSQEEKNEFNAWGGGGEILKELKGKATSLEVENQQSGSSESGQPTQPSQDEILASIQRENEAKKNNQNNNLERAESENATKEDIVEAVKGGVSNFGDESSQEQQQRQEVLEDKLAEEDPELYRQTMIDKINACLQENNITETELNLPTALQVRWTRLRRKQSEGKDEIKEITSQMLEQIIIQGNEKELKSIRERVQKSQREGISKTDKVKLLADIKRYLEKTKGNVYVKANAGKAEALLKEFNSGSKTVSPKETP
jgi:hypothetical protein